MAKSIHFRYVLLILCLGAATLPAQEADLLPPLPPPYAVPPPEPDTLPPPPQLEWSPLGPKDEGGGGSIIEAAMVPPPETEAPIAPPPPPVIETPLPGLPDPELAKPDVEVWRPESESPQTPARLPERLDTAYVAGPAPVWLRVQYNPLAAGKRVLVRTGRGITVNVPGGGLTIPPNGECLVQAQLGAGINRSHINFYCDGIKTALPVVLASVQTVEGAENGGGQWQGTASTGTAPSPDEDPEGDTGALREQVETGGSYSAHSGNASRIVKDLHVPGALGTYGLDFTRYWNSLNNADINIAAEWPTDFGYSGWSHSWRWKAVYDWELPDMEHFPPPYTYETSITITFPDGHATKFKLSRGDLNAPPLSRDHRVGPPYYAANYERDWAAPGSGVHDNLAEMAQDGSEFWLYRADGGSVHFVGTNGPNPGGYYSWRYKATEIYDPHGLKTQLVYEGDEQYPRLKSVVQEDGRWLRINWDNYNGHLVIGSLHTGFAGSQQGDQHVMYGYTGTGSVTLSHVFYLNTPAMYQTAWATYDYQPNVLSGPSLMGQMIRISRER